MSKRRAITPGNTARGRKNEAEGLFLYYYSPSPLRLPEVEQGKNTVIGRFNQISSRNSTTRHRSNRVISPINRDKNRVFRAIWTRLEHEEGRPEVREGAAMAECCGVLYLYGGLNAAVQRDMYSKQTVEAPWRSVKVQGMEMDARYGHTMLESSTQVIVFGGNTTSNLRAQIRDCLNTVRILEPHFTSNALLTSFLSTKGTSIDMRRYHSACILGRHMVVIGGLNQKNKVLDDCSLLDITSCKWTSVRLVYEAAALACHTSAAVYEPHIALTGVFDPVLNETSPLLKHRGIYLFGGVNNKGEPNNTVRLIQPAQKYLVCTILQTTGKTPLPRYQHSMVFFKHNNTLIIFGGKTGSPGNPGNVLNDLHILDLETLNWSETVVVGHVPQPRCAHAMGTLQGKVVLFGGINLTTFCSTETYWLDLEMHKPPTNAPDVFAFQRFRSSTVLRKMQTARLNQTLSHQPWTTSS